MLKNTAVVLNGLLIMVIVMSESNVKTILGSNLKLLREREDMTQRDICIVLNIAPQTYCGWEKGRFEPSLEKLVLLSRFYGVTVDSLLVARPHKVRPVRLFK